MKILLLNPPHIDQFTRTCRLSIKSNPSALVDMHDILEQQGFDVKLINANKLPHFQGLFKKENLKFDDFIPNLIFMETSEETIYNDTDVAKYIKTIYPNTNIIMVGVPKKSKNNLSNWLQEDGLWDNPERQMFLINNELKRKNQSLKKRMIDFIKKELHKSR